MRLQQRDTKGYRGQNHKPPTPNRNLPMTFIMRTEGSAHGRVMMLRLMFKDCMLQHVCEACRASRITHHTSCITHHMHLLHHIGSTAASLTVQAATTAVWSLRFEV